VQTHFDLEAAKDESEGTRPLQSSRGVRRRTIANTMVGPELVCEIMQWSAENRMVAGQRPPLGM